MSGLLQDQSAIVTGGTRGIGRAIVDLFLREGACVVLTGRDEARAAAVAAEAAAAAGRDAAAAIGIAADLSTSGGAVQAMGKAIERLGGKVDILVNNAGLTRDTLALRMGEEEWDTVINTDLTAVFCCIKAVLKPMLKARYGRIVNLSSVVALSGNAGQCNYAAAKAGVLGLTKSLAREVASRNITVNAVAPGFVDTDMTASLGDELRQRILAQIPLGRIAAPAEIADAVLFLASAHASYITGQCLSVNGGLAMP